MRNGVAFSSLLCRLWLVFESNVAWPCVLRHSEEGEWGGTPTLGEDGIRQENARGRQVGRNIHTWGRRPGGGRQGGGRRTRKANEEGKGEEDARGRQVGRNTHTHAQTHTRTHEHGHTQGVKESDVSRTLWDGTRTYTRARTHTLGSKTHAHTHTHRISAEDWRRAGTHTWEGGGGGGPELACAAVPVKLYKRLEGLFVARGRPWCAGCRFPSTMLPRPRPPPYSPPCACVCRYI